MVIEVFELPSVSDMVDVVTYCWDASLESIPSFKDF